MWDSPAIEQYDEGISGDSRRVDIDGLEEARCAALVQSTRFLEGIRCYHDRNVKERLVYRLPWGLKSTRLLQNPFAVSGLRVQALVSGLLYSKIQR
jgi:hypothetical protein